jgi:hypothetical protein
VRPLKLAGPHADAGEVWTNRAYHVVRREMAAWDGRPLVHLAVSRHDLRPARDWRHLQQIKTSWSARSARPWSCSHPRAAWSTPAT